MQVLNFHHYNRYIKFINSRPYRDKPKKSFSGLEGHHILPSSMGGNDDVENICYLTEHEHYLVHWMLAKALGGKMWFAFNQMKRAIPGEVKNSSLYTMSRKYISEQVSISNSGRKWTDEQREACSIKRSGTVIVKPSGEEKTIGIGRRVSVSDPKYMSGELVPVQTGRKNTPETKLLMSMNNGIKNKQIYYHKDTLLTKYFEGNEDTDGYVKGFSPDVRDKISNGVAGLRHFYSPITLHQIRMDPNIDHVPEGYVSGRVNGFQKGFSIVNDPNNVTAFSLATKTCRVVGKDNLNDDDVITPLNSSVVIFDTCVFESVKLFNMIFEHHFPPIHHTVLDKLFVPHCNHNSVRLNFCIEFENLSWRKLGFDIIPVKLYNGYVKGKTKVIRRLTNGRFDSDTFVRIVKEKRRTISENYSAEQ